MRFRTSAVAVTAALSMLTVACGSSGGSGSSGAKVAKAPKFAAGTAMARISQAGKVKVGTKFDQPLFGLKGLNGKPQGFDVEVAKIIAGAMGVKADNIEWVETPSKVREEKIEQGTVDFVVATYTINDKRKKRITFAGPYYIAGQDLMVKKDNSAITGPDTLKGQGKVCSVTGSTPSETIKKYIDPSQLVLFDVYSKCADALRTGQVAAVTTDNVILLGLVDQSKGAFKLVGKPFTQEPYGIGLKKGDKALCTFINTTLTKAGGDGSYEKAWTSTAGKVSKDVLKVPPADACV